MWDVMQRTMGAAVRAAVGTSVRAAVGAAVGLGLLVASSLPAAAQAPAASMEERLRTQLRATTAQLQQVQNELAAIKAAGGVSAGGVAAAPTAPTAPKDSDPEVAALRRELAQARAALAQEREARVRQEQQSGDTRKTAQESVERSAEQVGKFRDAYQEVLRIARTSEAERVRLAAGVQAQEQALARCDLKNRELYRVGREILDEYEALDPRKVVEARHLFAARARVQLEETAQRLGDQLYAARFDRAQPLGPAAPEASAPAGEQR